MEKVATMRKDKISFLTFELEQMKGELNQAKAELTDYKTEEEER